MGQRVVIRVDFWTGYSCVTYVIVTNTEDRKFIRLSTKVDAMSLNNPSLCAEVSNDVPE